MFKRFLRWLQGGPSDIELMVGMMKEHNAAMMEVFKSLTAQTNVFGNYLNTVMSRASEPNSVRVMNDEQEALIELDRKKRFKQAGMKDAPDFSAYISEFEKREDFHPFTPAGLPNLVRDLGEGL